MRINAGKFIYAIFLFIFAGRKLNSGLDIDGRVLEHSNSLQGPWVAFYIHMTLPLSLNSKKSTVDYKKSTFLITSSMKFSYQVQSGRGMVLNG